jgi:hypothetical protein
MVDEHINQAQKEFISPVNSPASKTDQIQKLVDALASHYNEVNQVKPGRVSQSGYSGRDLPGHDLKIYTAWLAVAHRTFREASYENSSLTFASEWVLDNYYIIRQALQQIKEDLPSSFYKQLPELSSGQAKGLPRIYAIAGAVLAHQNYG